MPAGQTKAVDFVYDNEVPSAFTPEHLRGYPLR